MDLLEFRGDPVRIFINSIDLLELVQAHELAFASREGHPKLAGDYGLLGAQELYSNLRRGAGRDRPYATVLDCPCGCPGCWPLRMRLKIATETVTWTHFRQVFRAVQWDYSGFGPFVFGRSQYAGQMSGLKRAARLSAGSTFLKQTDFTQ